MTTAYLFQAGFTKLGIATAPSSAPTITVVDSANNIVVAALTATSSIANLPGAYFYSYTGTAGLILFGLFHTSDTTIDAQDLFSIPNPFTIIETAGTNVGTILADYARRSGDYSTLAAGAKMDLIDSLLHKVSTSGYDRTTDSLEAIGEKTTTITTDYARRTGDYATIAAIWDAATSGLSADNSIGKLLVTDINATIGSRSSHSVADIWNAATSGLTTLASIGKLLVDNINATISGRSSHSVADIWAALTSGLTTSGSIGKLLVTNIDAKISSPAGSGSGSVAYTPSRATDANGSPLAGVDTWANTSSTNSNSDVQARAYTNELGLIDSPFMLDPGTYYIWRHKDGYTFPNPETIEVDA
jgi:hypothetical protein